MKLWIDDVRPAPEGYLWCVSVDGAKHTIEGSEALVELSKNVLMDNRASEKTRESAQQQLHRVTIKLIDIDHDAGDYACDGGDYIKLLDWLEETGRNYPIHIHSMNPVGIANMRAIIKRNGWTEV